MFAFELQLKMVRSYAEAIAVGLRSLGCGARATITQATMLAVADEAESLFAMARDGSFAATLGDRVDVSDAQQPGVLGDEFMRRVLDLQNLVAQSVEAFSQAVGELQRSNDAARRKAKGVADKDAKLDESEDVVGMPLLARHYAIHALDSHRSSFEQACEPLVNLLIAVRLSALTRHMQG